MKKLQELTPYIKQASHPIQSDKDLAEATALLSTLNRLMDELKADKDKLIAPLKESVKAIQEKYKPLEEPLKQAIEDTRFKLTTYATLKTMAKEQEEQKILDDKRTSTTTKINRLAEITPLPDVVATEQGKITFTTVTKYRLVNPAKVPTELLEINTPALKQYLKAGNPLPEGIEVYEEQSLRNYRP